MRFALLLLLLATCTGAQVTVPKAARLFDGRSDTLQRTGIVVVLESRIVSVGLASEVPGDATLIDLGDATLLPGFMDAHTQQPMPTGRRAPSGPSAPAPAGSARCGPANSPTSSRFPEIPLPTSARPGEFSS